MKCFYCNNGKVDRGNRGLPKCNKCEALYYFESKSDQIREVIFFVIIDDEHSYRIDHRFEDNRTLIYKISIEGKYVRMKVIFSADLFDINPHNAEHFFKNKLKLYQLFS